MRDSICWSFMPDERSPSGPFQRGVGPLQLCGAAVSVAVGNNLTVLAEYVTGRSTGIDLILFPGRVRVWAVNNVPGRASPYSAVVFLLAGLAVALLDIDAGRRHRPARALTAWRWALRSAS